MRRRRVYEEDGQLHPVASVQEAMRAAETPAEVWELLLWAKTNITGASRGTVRKWERQAEKLAASLQIIKV